MICDHHFNKNIWTPFVDEVLHVEQEMHNAQDCFAVAIVKDGILASWPCAGGHVKFTPCSVPC